MTLKRPVTLAAARRWPAAAARRESFCARMGGMREKLTSHRTARDPRSKINRALAAWDCDKPELLERKHVTKGVRRMRITKKMVGAEAQRNPAPAAIKWEMYDPQSKTQRAMVGGVEVLVTPVRSAAEARSYEMPDWTRAILEVAPDKLHANTQLPHGSMSEAKDPLNVAGAIQFARKDYKPKTNPRRKPTVSRKISQLTREGYPQRQAVAIALSEQRAGKVRSNPDTWGTAPLGKVRSVIARQKATGELRTFLMADTSGKRVPTPYHFGFRLNLEGENLEFVGRYSGPLLIVSEKSTGLRLPGDVPFSKRSAYGNDKEAAKSWTLDLVERVGARKLVDKVKAAR